MTHWVFKRTSFQTCLYSVLIFQNFYLFTVTNEIPDNTINGQIISSQDVIFVQTPECALCTEIIREVENHIVNKDSKEQIKHALEHVCDKMKKMKKKCHDYVDNHSDLIIDLIIKGFAPKEICRELQLCSVAAEEFDDSTEDREFFFIIFLFLLLILCFNSS